MFDEVEQVILREMKRSRLPGLAVALVKDEEIVWSKGYGLADLEAGLPVTPGTVFPACSVTKPVVATAVMQWHERGAFALDDPVNVHMGAVKLQNEWEQQSPVTIRHLLTHSSGLPVALAYPLGSSFSSLEEYVGAVARTVRPAGEEVIYADWGYAVLGHLVGRFAGCPYEEYIHENLLDPLGMRSSALSLAPAGASLAAGYYVSGADGKRYRSDFRPDAGAPGPAGSLYSTAEDLARFLIAHLNGGVRDGKRILLEETADDMKRVHARTGPAWRGMGLGFMVDEVGGRRLFWHAGNGPAGSTFICGSREENVGVVLLINLANAETARSAIVHSALHALAADGRDTPVGTSQDAWRLPPAECERLTGRYISNLWARAELRADEGILTLRTEPGGTIDPVESVSYLERIGEGRFRVHDGGFGGWELTFEFAADGNANSFVGGVYPFLFRRSGDVLPAAAQDADLAGRWAGIVSSPMGPVPVTLDIMDAERGSVTALSAQRAQLQDFSARNGHLSGYFEVAVGDLGDWTVFLRLASIGGKLQGRAYARSGLGEMPMDVELSRE